MTKRAVSLSFAASLIFGAGPFAGVAHADKKMKASVSAFIASYSTDITKWPVVAGHSPIARGVAHKSPPSDLARLSHYIDVGKHYYNARGGFDGFLAQEHRDPAIAERVAATRFVIEQAKGIDDLAVKGFGINYYVNNGFKYNSFKVSRKADWKKLYKHWNNAPQETVAQGGGVCMDQTALKAELLIRSGVPEKDITFLTLKNTITSKPHQVLYLNGREYGGVILDNDQLSLPVSQAQYFAAFSQSRVISASDLSGKRVLMKKDKRIALSAPSKPLTFIPIWEYKKQAASIVRAANALNQKYRRQKVPVFSGSWKVKPSALDNG